MLSCSRFPSLALFCRISVARTSSEQVVSFLDTGRLTHHSRTQRLASQKQNHPRLPAIMKLCSIYVYPVLQPPTGPCARHLPVARSHVGRDVQSGAGVLIPDTKIKITQQVFATPSFAELLKRKHQEPMESLLIRPQVTLRAMLADERCTEPELRLVSTSDADGARCYCIKDQ